MSDERVSKTIFEASGILTKAVQEHARVHAENSEDAEEAIWASDLLAEALEIYRLSVMNEAGWSVPYEILEPPEDGETEEPTDSNDAGNIVEVVARYTLSIGDPVGAYALAERRSAARGRKSELKGEPEDIRFTVRELFLTDGWNPLEYDDRVVAMSDRVRFEVRFPEPAK